MASVGHANSVQPELEHGVAVFAEGCLRGTDLDEVEALQRAWYTRLRPAAAAELAIQILGPSWDRAVLMLDDGLRLYVDPFSHLARCLVAEGAYEPDTAEALSDALPKGGTFVDVGANEGYFSTLMGRKVGPDGLVVAVEPQQRLQQVIEINALLNEVTWLETVAAALSDKHGSSRISLFARTNTGASSLVREARHRGNRAQTCDTVTFDDVLRKCHGRTIDVVKVDVEGFEPEVVRGMLPALSAGRVRHVFLDYHHSILASRGISPAEVHDALIGTGMRGEPPQAHGHTHYWLRGA